MFKRKRFLISFEEAMILEERHYGGKVTYHMKEYVFGNPFTCVHQIVNTCNVRTLRSGEHLTLIKPSAEQF